jgi:hypothetical protein
MESKKMSEKIKLYIEVEGDKPLTTINAEPFCWTFRQETYNPHTERWENLRTVKNNIHVITIDEDDLAEIANIRNHKLIREKDNDNEWVYILMIEDQD